MHDQAPARPASVSVNRDGRIAELELASTASGSARSSSSAKTRCLPARSSGVFSWTWSAPASARSSASTTTILRPTASGAMPSSNPSAASAGRTLPANSAAPAADSGDRVVDPDVVSAARECDGPCPADQAGSDDGDGRDVPTPLSLSGGAAASSSRAACSAACTAPSRCDATGPRYHRALRRPAGGRRREPARSPDPGDARRPGTALRSQRIRPRHHTNLGVTVHRDRATDSRRLPLREHVAPMGENSPIDPARGRGREADGR